jgi:hypothetical protein
MNAASDRVDLLIARARASLLATHAQLSQELVGRLGDRLPTLRLIDLYSSALDLKHFEEVWLRIHAIAHGGGGDSRLQADRGRHSAVRRAWDGLLDEIRVAIAPHGDGQLQERLTYELANARSIVMKLHVRNAVALARTLAQELSAPAAVGLYIQQLDVTRDLRAAVFALALAQLRSDQPVAMLLPGQPAR